MIPAVRWQNLTERLSGRWALWTVLAAFVYGGLQLLWYWQTPLGRIPVLDEVENLTIARQIAEGALPSLPFYRGMGYPSLLSLPIFCGVPISWMPNVATGFGLLLHALNTWLAGTAAVKLSRRSSSGWIAGLLYGLNPVFIHYANQILDATLSNTLLLGGIVLLLAYREKAKLPYCICASVCWAVAFLVRPQNLLVWFSFPFCLWLASPRMLFSVLLRRAGLAMLMGGTLLLLQGLIQLSVCGQFRIMPAQGAYNLWAANRPGAHGRYFVQSIHLDLTKEPGSNPTAIESRVLYEKETGRSANELDEVNAYWSRKLRHTIVSDPVGFFQRMAWKGYYLLNDAEQYNNKTFSFHKERSPVLRFNPIGWGLLLCLAVVGGLSLYRNDPPAALFLGLVALAIAASVAAAYVSARFRLPLAACLTIAAGALPLLPAAWRAWSLGKRVFAVMASILVLLVAFSNYGGVRSTDTYVQDHLLIARAAVQAGDDAEAWRHAGFALTTYPDHPDALAWRIASYFNMLVSGNEPSTEESDWLEASRRWLADATRIPSPVTATAGFALWRSGNPDAAVDSWRRLAQKAQAESPQGHVALASALGALVITKHATAEESRLLAELAAGGVRSPLILLANAEAADPAHRQALQKAASRLCEVVDVSRSKNSP